MATHNQFTPTWSPIAETWMVSFNHPVFGDISILLKTDGQHAEPSREQMETVNALMSIDASIRPKIASAAKTFAENWFDPDQFACLEDEDVDLDLAGSGGIVPPTYANRKTYAILHGHSLIDPEHGLACVFDCEGNFGIAHADTCFSPPDQKDFAELERALSGQGYL